MTRVDPKQGNGPKEHESQNKRGQTETNNQQSEKKLYNAVPSRAELSITVLHCVIPYHSIPNHMVPFHTVRYLTIPNHTILYNMVPFHSIPFRTKPYRTLPFQTIPNYSLQFHTIPFHTVSYHTKPYYSVSYHSKPFHSVWHRILPPRVAVSQQPPLLLHSTTAERLHTGRFPTLPAGCFLSSPTSEKLLTSSKAFFTGSCE